ncbi:MAG TPA: RagB/SusD family nutrient uptake outer membrane protein [Longimicrobiales bacterium]|nr:RagB/SusD family nutrient uptake outer membrane protein [Longimicrobiales bacterium]
MMTIDRKRSRTAALPTAMLAALGAFAAAACGDELVVPDFNNPGLEELQNNPTRAAVLNAAQGLLISSRAQISSANGYVSLLGILGRESYNFDGSDPRFVTEMLAGAGLNASSPAFGGNLWTVRYNSIRTANVVINALDGLSDNDMSPAEKAAVRGFARTLQALDFLEIINTRDTNGAVIDVDRPASEPAGPIVSRDAVFDHIESLLDQANSDLAAAGASFPFSLGAGYSGFNTPVTFSEFNRGLAARVAVYRGNYGEALTALGQSFLDTSAPLDLGVYHTFSTGSGDTQNGLAASPDILAHPSLDDDAQMNASMELDARFTEKLEVLAAPETQQGISTDVGFLLYSGLGDPIPIIKNEELILLRAEALLGLNMPEDAADDINFIRVNSGGLDPIANLGTQSADAILDELLYNKRYSLLFEGGHRWIDMRRYGKLDELPLASTGHRVHERFPVPEAECLEQTGGETGICSAGS